MAVLPGWSLAHAEPPAPAARAELDVDGDGALDVVTIDAPAAVSVQLSRPAPALARPALWKPYTAAQGAPVAGAITHGSGESFAGRTVIVATAWFENRSPRGPIPGRAARIGQAMVLSWNSRAGKLDKLWEGSVGAKGSDDEYQVVVEASPLGLIRYQHRSDIRRCDGRPAYLFAQRFEFKSRRFRPVTSPTYVPDGAPVLTATSQAPADMASVGAVSFRTQSVSVQAYANHAGELVPPRELDDSDPGTAWRETTGGNGHGAFITLTSPMASPEVVAMRIVPGDASAGDAFRASNRLRRVGLVLGSGHAFWIEFRTDPVRAPDFKTPYWVVLPEGIHTNCASVVLDQVYPGRAARSSRGGDTAISDIAVVTRMDLDRKGAEAALCARVIAGGSEGAAAARVLARRGKSAVTAITAELERGGLSAATALRLRRILARIGDPGGAEQLVGGLTAQAVSVPDRRMFASALVRMGAEAIPALAALLEDDQDQSRARRVAARVLASMPVDSAREALTRMCGRGDSQLRRVVAVGLGHRAVADLPGLLDVLERAVDSGNAGCEADAWRSIGLMVRRAPDDMRQRVAQAMASRIAVVTDYELRYRLLDAAARLSEDAALAAVLDAVARLSRETGPHARALRRVTASALAGNPRSVARQLLLSMAADEDPGVRVRAVAALGAREDADEATDRVVMAHLGDDPWPRIRKLAAAALGHRCGTSDATRAALDRAVDSDDHVDVQREALAALVECRAPGIGQRLIGIASDNQRQPSLRQRSLSLLPSLDDPSLTQPLIDLFAGLRKRAWSESSAVRMAAAAAVAMGRLGTDDVIKPLMRAANEASFPEIQAAAVTGLGEICPKQAVPVFARLIRSGERAVVVAARGAYNRCRERR